MCHRCRGGNVLIYRREHVSDWSLSHDLLIRFVVDRVFLEDGNFMVWKNILDGCTDDR